MKHNYGEYESFSYLDKDLDMNRFELAKEYNEFEPYTLPLTKEEESRFEDVINKYLIISAHEHTMKMPKDMADLSAYAKDGHIHTGYKGLSESVLDCVFENFLDGISGIISKGGWKWDDIIYDLGIRYSDWAHQNMLVKACKVEDILKAKQEGKIAMVSVLEGSAMIENDLDRIDILYGFGVRSMGITYEEANLLGCGKGERYDSGLTNLGKRAVDRMNRLGILIDFNHASNKTALDIIKTSKKPVITSHTSSRTLREDKRGRTDDCLKACADKGGVIGIAGCPGATNTPNNPKSSLEGYMEHFEYMKNLVGIDHVAFGVDTMYGDHVACHKILYENDKLIGRDSDEEDLETVNKSFEKCRFVKGLENPTEASINIIRWLVKHNYSDEDIKKVSGDNIIRLLKEVWY